MNWLENFLISQSDKLKIEEIKDFIQKENYNEALLNLEILIGDKILFVDLYAMKTFCYIKKQMFQQANDSLKIVFEIEKDNKEGFYYLGLINKYNGNFDRALENYRQALNYGYNSSDIYNEIALIYIKQKETDKAINQLKISISKYNNCLDTYKILVSLLISQKNFISAIDFCNQALNFKNDYQISCYLADCYTQINEYHQAISLYKSLIDDAKDAKIYNELANLYIKISNNNLALEITEQGLIIYSKDLELKIRKLEILYHLEKYNYIVTFSQTTLINEDARLLCFMGIGSFYNDLKEKAKNYFEQSIKIEKYFLNTFYLGVYYSLEKKDHQIASNLLIESLNHAKNNNEKLKALSKIYYLYFEMQDYDQSLKFAKKALEISDLKQPIEIFIKSLHKSKFEIDKSEKNNDIETKSNFIKSNHQIYDWLKKVKHYLKKYHSFEMWENKIDEIIYNLNTPLSIAVMGEFKAGKSTFINALIGKEIAPMGVTPTTATLNFFKYGEKNKIKIIKSDQSYEELEIQMLSKYVDERVLNKETIDEISYIEILFAWDKLKEINIIDTPGLNAGIKRHEDITQEFIKKSDIVIWLFDVEQAGKSSEKKVLDKIKLLSKDLIAVVNGIDKVDNIDEVVEVIDYLKGSLGEYFEQIVGISAKKALQSKILNDEKLYLESGFKDLEKYLQENIYSKVTKIKMDSLLKNIDKIFNELAKFIEIERLNYQNNFKSISKLKEKIINFERELASIDFLLKNKLKSDFELIILTLVKDIKGLIKPNQGIIENVFKKNKFETSEKQFILATLKTKIKNSLNNYNENLNKEIKEKSDSLLNNILYNHKLSDSKKEAHYNDSSFDFLKQYIEQKQQSIYNSIIYPNYRYYEGFLDAGALEYFFDEISGYPNLNQEDISNTLFKYLPNIFDNLANDFIEWKIEYIDFLNIFLDNKIREFKDKFFDLDTQVFEQLLLLYSEVE